jgi:hypothetical protein
MLGAFGTQALEYDILINLLKKVTTHAFAGLVKTSWIVLE